MNACTNIEFALEPFQKRNYGVMYVMHKKDKIDTIKYEVCIQCLEKDKNENKLIAINRISKTYVNDELANEFADEFADLTAQVIYPLVVVVNKKGLCKKINNFSDILKRWKNHRQKISQIYAGEFVEAYLSTCENTLANRESLETALKNDYFLNTYFNDIHKNYIYNRNIQNYVSFPILANELKVPYNVHQNICKNAINEQLLCIELNGSLQDNQFNKNGSGTIEFGFESANKADIQKATGNYIAKYYINKKEKTIDSIHLECDLEAKEYLKTIVLISSIENKKGKWFKM